MTVLVIIISFSILLAGSISFFAVAPQIGAKAEGERLERMMTSKNYRNGKFINSVPTKMNMKAGKMMGVMWEFLTGNHKREPSEMIRVNEFNKDDLMNLEPGQDAFVWFGHSSVLIRIDDKTLLIDPVFSERASMFPFMGPKRFRYSHYVTVDMLPPLDAVLISHDHYDHLDYKTMLKLSGQVPLFFVPLGVGAHLEKWGIPKEKIIELNWWESTSFKDLELLFTPSRHFSGRGLNNRFSTLWGSWIISGNKNKIFFGGDSGYFNGFKEIGDKYGPFDLTFLECGAYNENWPEIHMMPEETIQAHVELRGKQLMPIHWGKFNLSLHPWKEPIERANAKARGLNVNIVTPAIGEILLLNEDKDTSAWWRNYH